MRHEDIAVQIAAYYFVLVVLITWISLNAIYFGYKLIVKLIRKVFDTFIK